MRQPGRFCGAKVVEPLRSSPLGLEPGCTLSKQQQQQQQLNKRSSPDSPKIPFPQGFAPSCAQQLHHAMWVSAPITSPVVCRGACPSWAPCIQEGCCFPALRSPCQMDFALPFQTITSSPKK